MIYGKFYPQILKTRGHYSVYRRKSYLKKPEFHQICLGTLKAAVRVSDTTLINLAAALKTDTYRLFMPETIHEDENYKTALRDLTKTFEKAQADFGLTFANALKLWGIKK